MKTVHIWEPGQWWLKELENIFAVGVGGAITDEMKRAVGIALKFADTTFKERDKEVSVKPVAFLDVEGLPEKGMKYATQFRVNDRQSALFYHQPSEPDGEVVVAVDSPNDAAVIRWVSDYRPKVGDKIYALRAAKEGK